jgi:hypothetical protein
LGGYLKGISTDGHVDFTALSCKTYDSRCVSQGLPFYQSPAFEQTVVRKMELFLNVLWLLLAVPAVWVWHRGNSSSHAPERLGSLHCLLILGCTLMLLFPVVSATDDLHAVRSEMEEPSFSKQVIKPAAGAKSSARLSSGIPYPVQLAYPFWFTVQNCGKVVAQSDFLPAAVDLAESTGRAPPSRLG